MENILIQKAELQDVSALQKISAQTFQETFSESNSPENMDKYLRENLSLEKLTSELSNENSQFYFAILNNHVIGYLKINFRPSQTELNDNKALEIERIYVLQEFHGKKIGNLLYTKALEIAEQNNAKYIWLGVWEKNIRALQFYKKNGFAEFDQHIFRLGDDEQTDLMMKFELRKN